MTIPQVSPGILQLANELVSGISAESVAYAEMGRSMNTMGNTMTSLAQDQYVKAGQANGWSTAMTVVQWALGLVTAGTGTALAAVATTGIGEALTGMSAEAAGITLSAGVGGAAQA